MRSFFTRVDRILRRSLGVSETAPTDDTVRPAPPVDPSPPADDEFAFDDTHVPLDPELLGLKVGEPVLETQEKPQVLFEVEEVEDYVPPVAEPAPVAEEVVVEEAVEEAVVEEEQEETHAHDEL